MELLYQQDDCAPDSYDYFLKKFQEIIGQSFHDWKLGKTNCSSDEYVIILKDDNYMIECSADDPYWTLYKLS